MALAANNSYALPVAAKNINYNYPLTHSITNKKGVARKPLFFVYAALFTPCGLFSGIMSRLKVSG